MLQQEQERVVEDLEFHGRPSVFLSRRGQHLTMLQHSRLLLSVVQQHHRHRQKVEMGKQKYKMDHLQLCPHGSTTLGITSDTQRRLWGLADLSPAPTSVVMESVSVGIYLRCNHNTYFEMFSFIWVGCKSLLFFFLCSSNLDLFLNGKCGFKMITQGLHFESL